MKKQHCGFTSINDDRHVYQRCIHVHVYTLWRVRYTRFDYRLCAKNRRTMKEKNGPSRNSRATTTIGGFSTETTRPAALRTDNSDRRRTRAPLLNAHTLTRIVPLRSLSRRANCNIWNLTRPFVNKSDSFFKI